MKWTIFVLMFIVGCARVPSDSTDITEGRTKYPPAGMYCYCVESESTLTFCKEAVKKIESGNAVAMYKSYCEKNRVN